MNNIPQNTAKISAQTSTKTSSPYLMSSLPLFYQNISLKQKLIFGFIGLIVLMALNISIVIIEMKSIERKAVNVIEIRQPIVVRLLEFSDKLNLTTAYLKNFLLTELPEDEQNYLKLQSYITSEFQALRTTIIENKLDIGDETLNSFEQLLPKYNTLARKLITIRKNDLLNYPGLAKAAELLNPLALEYLSLVNNLLVEEIGSSHSKKHDEVIILLNDLRYSWVQMMNSIRIFFSARMEPELNNFNNNRDTNRDILHRLDALNVDIGFDGVAELKSIFSEYHSNIPIVMEYYNNNVWRHDVVIMSTEVLPLVDQLNRLLVKMSSSQLIASQNDGKDLTHSLLQIRLVSWIIFIISIILGVTLAIIIIKNIIPPIQRLMHAAQCVAEGDLESEVPQVSNDEIGKLTSSFNSMISDLRDANKDKQRYLIELEQWNQKLENRVELKINELQSTQNQLLQSEKLASIGQLAAGVAHEINNPVGYVNSNLGTLKTNIDDLFKIMDHYHVLENQIQDENLLIPIIKIKKELDFDYIKDDISSIINESQEGLTRVKQIVQDLKDFSHVDEADWQWADLHAGINSTLNVAQNEIKYKAEVIKEFNDIPTIECFPSQLNQVFMNLFVNSAHAIEEQGTITVQTGIKDDEVFVAVTDTGKGMDKETQSHIFEPFYTTKPVGTGTGLGLSLSYGIIEKHHGRIELKSEVGKGTTFTIWLPIKQPESEE